MLLRGPASWFCQLQVAQAKISTLLNMVLRHNTQYQSTQSSMKSILHLWESIQYWPEALSAWCHCMRAGLTTADVLFEDIGVISGCLLFCARACITPSERSSAKNIKTQTQSKHHGPYTHTATLMTNLSHVFRPALPLYISLGQFSTF